MCQFTFIGRRPKLLPAAGVLLAALCSWIPAAAQTVSADPVEELRQVLKGSGLDPAVREHDLQQRARALRTIADLRQALLLREWRDLDLEPRLAAADRAGRAAITL